MVFTLYVTPRSLSGRSTAGSVALSFRPLDGRLPARIYDRYRAALQAMPSARVLSYDPTACVV